MASLGSGERRWFRPGHERFKPGQDAFGGPGLPLGKGPRGLLRHAQIFPLHQKAPQGCAQRFGIRKPDCRTLSFHLGIDIFQILNPWPVQNGAAKPGRFDRIMSTAAIGTERPPDTGDRSQAIKQPQLAQRIGDVKAISRFWQYRSPFVCPAFRSVVPFSRVRRRTAPPRRQTKRATDLQNLRTARRVTRHDDR